MEEEVQAKSSQALMNSPRMVAHGSIHAITKAGMTRRAIAFTLGPDST